MGANLDKLISKKATIIISIYLIFLVFLLFMGFFYTKGLALRIYNGWQIPYLNIFIHQGNILDLNMLNSKLISYMLGVWFFYLLLGIFLIAGLFYKGKFDFNLRPKKISFSNIFFIFSFVIFLIVMLFNPTKNIFFVLPLSILAIFVFFLDEDSGFYIFVNKIINKILFYNKIKFLGLAILLFFFFYKFPIWDFNKIIFQDDYPVIYWASAKGLETIKQGSIFGWEPSMLGGYYNVSDISNNLFIFFLPFFYLDTKITFHIVILLAFISFPFLVTYLFELKAGKSYSNFTFLTSIFISFGFFNNILISGMVNSLLGIDMFLLNWILVERLLKGERYSISLLGLSFGLTLYTHISFFIYSAILIYALVFINWKKKIFLNLILSTVIAFAVTLPFAYYFLNFPHYFIGSNAQFNTVNKSFIDSVVEQFIKFVNFLKPLNYDARDYSFIAFFCLPFIFIKGKSGLFKLSLSFIYIIFIIYVLFSFPQLGMIPRRIVFLIPIFFIFIFSETLNFSVKTRSLFPVFILLVYMAQYGISMGTIPHIKSIRNYLPKLVDEINNNNDPYFLLESRAVWNISLPDEMRSEIPEIETHLESLIQLETGKNIYSNCMEGYHHSIYRGNSIISGTFRGKNLASIKIDEITSELDKWGIRKIYVWSNISKSFFSRYKYIFKKNWEENGWASFDYLYQKNNISYSTNAKVRLLEEDHFSKKIFVLDKNEGDRIILKCNYFPLWHAYAGGNEIMIDNNGGQLSLNKEVQPGSIVTLIFPKKIYLWIISILVVSSAFLVETILIFCLFNISKR